MYCLVPPMKVVVSVTVYCMYFTNQSNYRLPRRDHGVALFALTDFTNEK